MEYEINGACKSVIGNVRQNNEDNYYFNFKTLKEENDGSSKTETMQFGSSDNVICSVFDGMGGEAKGERAAYIASETLKEYIKQNEDNKFSWIKYITEANKRICDEMQDGKRMGTTIASVLFNKNNIDICNIGDSRIYGLKGTKMQQISKDHTDEEIQERLKIQTNHSKAKLTQHLGIYPEEMKLEPYRQIFKYTDFDKILICSDGLTDMLDDKKIEKIMSENIDAKKIVDELVEKALEKGGKDNTTVIVIEIIKDKKKSYKKVIPLLVTVLIIIVITSIIISKNSFKIIKDGYRGPIIVGESYEFEYKGNVEISFSNNNISLQGKKIIANKEGNCEITIKNKKGEILYKQTVKVFPK